MSAGKRPTVWKVAASIAIAIVLFAVFVARAPTASVLETLVSVRLSGVAAAVALAMLSYFLRAIRWGVILRPVGRPRVGALFGATAAGFAASTVLPARAGEVVRPLVLSSRAGLPAAATLASILAERLADLATVLALFAAGAVLSSRLVPGAAAPVRDSALAAAAFLALGIVFVLVLLQFRTPALRRIRSLGGSRFGPRIEVFTAHLLDGLEVVRQPRRLAALAGWSLAVWLPVAFQIQVLGLAFGLRLGLGSAFLVIAVSVVGLAVPTPAGVGAFHAAVQFALANLLGVDVATATAYALIHHAVCFFPITAIGLLYLGSVGLTPGTAAAFAAEPGNQGSEPSPLPGMEER